MAWNQYPNGYWQHPPPREDRSNGINAIVTPLGHIIDSAAGAVIGTVGGGLFGIGQGLAHGVGAGLTGISGKPMAWYIDKSGGETYGILPQGYSGPATFPQGPPRPPMPPGGFWPQGPQQPGAGPMYTNNPQQNGINGQAIPQPAPPQGGAVQPPGGRNIW